MRLPHETTGLETTGRVEVDPSEWIEIMVPRIIRVQITDLPIVGRADRHSTDIADPVDHRRAAMVADLKDDAATIAITASPIVDTTVPRSPDGVDLPGMMVADLKDDAATIAITASPIVDRASARSMDIVVRVAHTEDLLAAHSMATTDGIVGVVPMLTGQLVRNSRIVPVLTSTTEVPRNTMVPA